MNAPLTPVVLTIQTDLDLLLCREAARTLAMQIGFDALDQTRIATAVSEIVRNVLTYAGTGIMQLLPSPTMIRIVIEDHGPGIRDVRQAEVDGYSTAGSFGVGIGGAKRLMDALEISSEQGKGTRVDMRKTITSPTGFAIGRAPDGMPA